MMINKYKIVPGSVGQAMQDISFRMNCTNRLNPFVYYKGV